jgi:hypothetical protein
MHQNQHFNWSSLLSRTQVGKVGNLEKKLWKLWKSQTLNNDPLNWAKSVENENEVNLIQVNIVNVAILYSDFHQLQAYW